MIYFISDSKEEIVKIGFSSNPEQRLKELQVTNFVDLKIVKVYKGTFRHEQYLHNLFKKERRRNEIFNFSEYIKDYIKNNDVIDIPPVSIQLDNSEYLMVYLDDMDKFMTLQSSIEFKILFSICNLLNYNEIELYITKREKSKMAELLGVKTQSVSDTLGKLKKKGFIINKDRSFYSINPKYFFKGTEAMRNNFLHENFI